MLQFQAIEWRRQTEGEGFVCHLIPNIRSHKLYTTVIAAKKSDAVLDEAREEFRQSLINLRNELNQMDLGEIC